MYRKKAVIKSGGYRPKYEGAEDYDLWSRLIHKYDFSNIQEVLLTYRVHKDSVGSTKQKKQKQLAREISVRNISNYLPISEEELAGFKVKKGRRVSVHLKGSKQGKTVLDRIKSAFIEKEQPTRKQVKLIDRYYAKAVRNID